MSAPGGGGHFEPENGICAAARKAKSPKIKRPRGKVGDVGKSERGSVNSLLVSRRLRQILNVPAPLPGGGEQKHYNFHHHQTIRRRRKKE